MEQPFPRSPSTSPPTEGAVEGAGNEEPNEAERIGWTPARTIAPVTGADARWRSQTIALVPSPRQLKLPLTRHQSALSYGRPSGRPPVLACKSRPLIDKEMEINSQFGPGMRPEWKIPFSFLCSLQRSSEKYDERS